MGTTVNYSLPYPADGTPRNTGKAIRSLATAVDTALDAVEDSINSYDGTSQYGEHLVVWNGTEWRYRGEVVVARPTTASFANGARVIWDTSLYSAVTTPPTLAVAGDVWIPHGEVTP